MKTKQRGTLALLALLGLAGTGCNRGHEKVIAVIP